ncbi:MAG: hypothetical protein U1E81_16135 [Xanthobacteraceae bacterium]
MGATSIETVKFSNISATTAAFTLKGGKYAIVASATFGGGNLQLQALAADGSTYVNVGSSITAAGLTTYDLPPGSYKIAVTTATAVYVSITSVPA